MKKTLLNLICFFAFLFTTEAQTLFGTTWQGGSQGGGTITKFTVPGNNLTVAKSFESIEQYPLFSTFIQASNGKLYGMTYLGGSNGAGVIFSFDPASSTYTKVKDFDNTNGRNPYGSLMQASDGKLYGMTSQGGSNGAGVIFSFDPASSTYTKVKDFDNTNGRNPYGSLMQASDGKLYGMTSQGGSNGAGVIFSFDPASSTYTKVKDFDNTNGGYPYGSLMQASDGKLYGMTLQGGSSGYGVIFSFDPASSTYTKVKDFDNTNGRNPYGSLMQASDGKLYGMTSQGGSNGYGVIFSFDPASSTYTKVKDFDNTNGRNPYGSLMQASDGKLYGMTYQGGSSSYGVIFSFDPASSTYTKVKDFDNTNGGYPYGSLMQASDGKLYGMTLQGGSSGYGVIFSFDPASSTYTKVKDFDNTNGRNPYGSLMQASDGKLYGMTSQGGSNGAGVIFSFDPASSTYTKVKDFDNTNGRNPYGSLMQASDGKLYGMTSQRGSNGAGVIFSFDPASSTYTKVKDFDNTNGGYPYGSLMQASDGKLYGMTLQGGSSGYGVIFSFDPSSSTYTKVKDFDNTNGGYPYGSLMQASDGKLYGMTYQGGSNGYGVIFSFDPSSSIYTKVKDFDNTNGGYPYGSLMQASDGKLYGMTGNGGSSGHGVIFSFDPSSSAYTKVKDFDNTNGAYPLGSLMQASDGKLYGMTANGGNSDNGVIFSFDPSSSTYTKLQDYTGSNGAYPYYGSAFVEVKSCPTISVTALASNSAAGSVLPKMMNFNTPGVDNVTFAGQGPGAKTSTGRTNIYSAINTTSYNGLWWTFTPIENPRHSSQGGSSTGQMVFSSYDASTGIATFTSTANITWAANSGIENIGTRLRMQLQPYTGSHSGPVASGWIIPVTAGGISFGSLPAGYPLIDIKATGATGAYQVWYIIETAGGTPLDDYYATYPHTSTAGGSTITSQTGSFFSSAPSTCNGGPATVIVSATGGVTPYAGTGTFSATTGDHTYTVTDANGCSGSTTITVTAPAPIVVTALASNSAAGSVLPKMMNFNTPGVDNVTFAGQGPGAKTSTGRTNIYSAINTTSYNGLWWTFTPIENPRHSSQGGSSTGQMVFSSYDASTGIATFTSTANITWAANSGIENIGTRLRMQLQSYTGSHSGPVASGWIIPVTAGGISFGSLPAGYPLIDIKATGATGAYQVWFIIETAGGTPLDDYYATYPHTSTAGGSTITSQTGSFFSSAPSTCNGGPATVTVSATGGVTPYAGTGTFSATTGDHTYTVTDANGCSGSAAITVTPPTPITVTAVASNNAAGAVLPKTMNFGAGGDVTFVGSGNPKSAGGKTNIYSAINTTSYGGLWWTFYPIENPRHSSQGSTSTGQMVFNNYNAATGIITFTSTANMTWSANSGTENVGTRVRMQLQPYTGTNTGPIASGFYTPVTAGGISLASLASGYALIDIKALGATAAYQVWFIIEIASGTPVDDYYATYPHTSTVGGSIITSLTGSFFSSAPSTCNGGPATVIVSATGGVTPYAGTGTFSATTGDHTYTVTDANGCSGASIITVAAQNCIELNCVTDKLVNTDANTCSAIVNNIDPVITPAESPVNYALTGATTGTGTGSVSGKFFNLGPTTVTYTSVNEPAKQCTFIITVEDKVNPTVHTNNITVQLDATGAATISPAQINNVSTDNCSIPANGYSLDKTIFDCTNVGANMVTLSVTDANGNSATGTATVTVQDKVAPTVFTQNITVQLDANGAAIITPAQINNVSTDNCSIPATGYSLDKTTFDCSNVGANTVTLTVTDANLNSATGTATVTVQDKVAPTVHTQNIIVQLDATGHVTITPAQINNASTDNCSIPATGYSLDKTTFDCSNVGANTVTLTVTDANVNSATGTATVTVQDKVAPTVHTQNIIVPLDATGHVIITPAQINNVSTDNCSIPATGYSLDKTTFDCTNVGANMVTLSVTDANGNSATGTATVTVQDKVAPTVFTQNITVQLDANGAAIITPAQINNVSTDNCSIPATGYSLDKTTFDCTNVGANTVTLTVTDANANSATGTATVTVQDKVAPTVHTQNIIVPLDATGHVTITPAQINNASTDNCSIPATGYSLDKTTFDCSNVGANTVTLTVTDANVNSATGTATVTVQDKVAPTVHTQNIIVPLDATGHVTITPAQINNASTDNCSIPATGYSLDKTAFDCSNVGANTVKLSVIDANGNSATGTATVTVQDKVAPTVFTQNITVQLDASGSASITPAQINNVSTDNCSIPTTGYSLNKTSFNCNNVGTNTVTLTVTDLNGNSATGTATVTVKDNIKPVANCKSISVYLGMNGIVTITPQDVDNGSSDNCSVSLSIDKNTFNTTNIGVNSVTLTATDRSGNFSSCTATVTVMKRPTTLMYTGDFKEQYSDQQFLTAVLKDQLTNTVLSGETIGFSIGSQSTSALTNVNGVASINLILTQDPAPLYNVNSNFAGDAVFLSSSDSDPFDITQEDARAYYSGALFASTSGATSTTATVTLSATVRDITAETTDPAYDPYAGDIRNATVTFINRDNNTVIASNVPVGLVNSSDLKTGTATYNWTVDIGNSNSQTYTIGIIVNNYYTRNTSDDNSVITVSKPLDDFITGGGYLILQSSAGLKAGNKGTKNNFGFNVKYNKSGTNLQGNINTIIRRTESDGILHVYQVKGNSMTSLAVNSAISSTHPYPTATFNGKANITDITNPLLPVSVDGNATLQVTMTDAGEPGSSDKIGITVWNKSGGLWYSSNWNGRTTIEQLLGGGNLVARSGTSISGTLNMPVISQVVNPIQLNVKVSPNPSTTSFKFYVESNSYLPIHIRIMDVYGRVIETITKVTRNETTNIGNNFHGGIYFAEVAQGDQVKVVKFIKLN
jgi:uncharacterized repeat protein (TIGR03803 family)